AAGMLMLGIASYSIARPGSGNWGGGGQGFTFWKTEEIVEELSLTPDQIQGLDEIEYTYQEKSIDPETRMKKARLELDHLLSQETFSEEEIGRLVDEITAGSTERIKLGLNKQIAIRGVLTSEQWSRIRQMRENRSRRMRMGKKLSGGSKGVRGHGREGRGWVGPDQDDG
ncbi:MAG: Spy/CpxP family protein refolding chaperone, partial [Candidatus Auribacterota bacterium]|nr:Spy/CpxP family protein refolding chaperone [Candidatus Auribacterota bacterium]